MGEGLFFHAPVSSLIFFVTIGLSYYALSRNPNIVDEWVLHPYRVFRERKYHMLVSHGMIHGNYLHLGINMIAFYSFAFVLEIWLGSGQIFVIYFGSMILGALLSTLRKQHQEEFRSLGASGAISGIAFAYILLDPTAKLQVLFLITMPAWLVAILFLGISYYFARRGPSIIDHEGHLWGAICGVILTVVLNPGVVENFFERLF